MSSIQDLITKLQNDGALTATLNNSIMAGADPNNLYFLTFHSYFPHQVMFYSYGTTVTIQVEIDGVKLAPFTLIAGGYKIISIPTGTKHFNAQATSVVVTKADYAYICTTF